MKSTTAFSMALLAATQFLTAQADQTGVQIPKVPASYKVITSQGCYKSAANMTNPKLTDDARDFPSSGACGKLFKSLGTPYSVLATSPSHPCLVGFVMPPTDDLVDDALCNYPCKGYPQEACGGLGKPGSDDYYSVYNTGNVINPAVYKAVQSTTTSSSSSTETSTTSKDPATVTQTKAAPTNTGDGDKKKGGGNVAGIAAGVVVGVVVLAAGIGGLFFFLRRRRNAEIEEEHRRNAAVNAFISGSKPPSSHGSISMTDSRLDPVLAHRRMSDGSIADNEDYSRRILRVTNA